MSDKIPYSPDIFTYSPYSDGSPILARESRIRQFEIVRQRVEEEDEDNKKNEYTPRLSPRAHLIEKSILYSPSSLKISHDFNEKNKKNKYSEASTIDIQKGEKEKISIPIKEDNQKPFREGETSYLDGILGLGLIMIYTHNFASLTWLKSHPEVLQTGTSPEVLRSPIGLILFFLVISRKIVTEFFRQKASLEIIQWSNLPSKMIQNTFEIGFLASFILFFQKIECSFDLINSFRQAEIILGSDGSPDWCSNISFKEVFSSLLQLFTNLNNQQQSSELIEMSWTIPIQVWGTIYVLMCLPIVLNLSVYKRFIFYTILIVSLGFSNSPFLTFFVGMMFTDFRASGLIKKLQNRSRITFLLIECTLSGLSILFLVHMSTQDKIVEALSKITFNNGNGEFGIGQNESMIGQPVLLFRSFIFFLWIEMSVTFQWLIGNFFLKAIGRVGMGFYFSQSPLLYILIPALTKRYHGNLYWDGLTEMLVACFILNYILGWILTYTIQKIGKMFGEWLVRMMIEKGFIEMIVQGLRNTINAIKSIPTLIVKDVPNATSNKIQSFKKGWYTIRNWRTPTPIVPPPSHPLQYGLHPSDLHSTLFDADISDNEQAVRTRKLLLFWSFMSPINAMIIPGIAITWALLNPWHKFITLGFGTVSTIWRVMWLFALPYCLITWLGFSIPDITRTPEQQKNRPVKREFIRNFFILSVTRGSNPEATRRAHSKLKILEKYHPSVRVCVLTDEPYTYPDLDNIVCPKSYKSPLGLAKHKARALDYFRNTMKLGPFDFVLHMDEESTMDPESLRGCFDFIRYQTHHIGQGIIIYNGHKYWANWKAWLFAIADTIRVGDDLARFSLQGNLVNRPIFGIHGSFLLLNGQVENEVGWDFSSLAEDFEFSQAAWMKGFTLGRVHGIVREQSPENFVDFMKQRRRWYMGIRQIKGVYHLPQLAIKLWTAGIFCLVATVINVFFSLFFSWSGPSPLWVYILSTFCFGAFQWLYLGGLLFQELDYGYSLTRVWQIPLHAISLIFIQPFMATVEGFAVIWAMSTEDGEVGFQVVKK